MFHALQRRLGEREEGFTLIELLVVVIIIGILAAIAIPTFLGQRERAANAAAQSDLRNAAVVQEGYFTDNGSYADNTAFASAGFNGTGDVTFAVVSGDATGYCMTAKHLNSPTTWELRSTVGSPAEGDCT